MLPVQTIREMVVELQAMRANVTMAIKILIFLALLNVLLSCFVIAKNRARF